MAYELIKDSEVESIRQMLAEASGDEARITLAADTFKPGSSFATVMRELLGGVSS